LNPSNQASVHNWMALTIDGAKSKWGTPVLFSVNALRPLGLYLLVLRRRSVGYWEKVTL